MRLSDGLTWTFGYDHRNQLIWAERRTVEGGSLELRLDYRYDVFARRIEESRWTQATGTTVQRFGHDGSDVLADLDGANALQVRYVRPDGIDALGARASAAGVVAWYFTDLRGSVIALTDGSGVLRTEIGYDGFGNIVSETDPGFGDRHKYTGREFQIDVGMQFNRGRWYDPATGTWTTEDPIRVSAGDYNYYRYVSNGPTLYTDPSGLYLRVTAQQKRHVETYFGSGNVTYEGEGGGYYRVILGDGARDYLIDYTSRTGGSRDFMVYIYQTAISGTPITFDAARRSYRPGQRSPNERPAAPRQANPYAIPRNGGYRLLPGTQMGYVKVGKDGQPDFELRDWHGRLLADALKGAATSPRVMAAAHTTVGLAVVAAGAAALWTGSPIGILVMAHGLDIAATGVVEFASNGEKSRQLLSIRAMRAGGASEEDIQRMQLVLDTYTMMVSMGKGPRGGAPGIRHTPTSEATITANPNKTTTLVGSYPHDLKNILRELNYPVQQGKMADATFGGNKGGFNLLNVSEEMYLDAKAHGGFFRNVNAKWIDEAVKRGDDIIVVSDLKHMYNAKGELTGFGKEIKYLQETHGYTHDPVTHRMVPPKR